MRCCKEPNRCVGHWLDASLSFPPVNKWHSAEVEPSLGQRTGLLFCTGDSDWGEHVPLPCFRYNTGVYAATGMTPLKAVFGVGAFQAWREFDLAYFQDEP